MENEAFLPTQRSVTMRCAIRRGTAAIIATVTLFAGPAAAETTDSFSLATAPPGDRQKVESAHRPARTRSYWISSGGLSAKAKAYYLPSIGDPQEIAVVNEKGAPSVTVEMPMGDGPSHGGNSIYLIDREVVDRTLVVKTAKRTFIQHSCGWGHDHKYEAKRLAHRFWDEAPLEIVCDELWNGNFHVETESGSALSCRTLSYGVPLSNVAVRVTTEQGWVKRLLSDEQGAFRFELIRDYYPQKWSDFNRARASGFLITAEHTLAKAGEWEGGRYDSTTMQASLPWQFTPSKQDYASYGYGLTFGAISLVVPAVGIYFYRERRKKPYREIVFDEKA